MSDDFTDAFDTMNGLDYGKLSVDQKIELSKTKALLAIASELSTLATRFPEQLHESKS